MHELPVTRSILGIVLRHAESNRVGRIVAVNLTVGPLSDLEPEWMQWYFDQVSRGTAAEGAELRVERSPLVFSCASCGEVFEATREELETVRCPECGSGEATVLSGTGYVVESMEVQ